MKTIIIVLLLSTYVLGQGFPAEADTLSLDHKFHNAGNVWQVITNLGYLGHHCQTTYAPTVKCEYPIGSGSSYLYGGSILVAGKHHDRKLFSMADAWSENSPNCAYEFYPTGAPWDTVWVVNRGETVDIPYLPNYTGLADQDFVCRYRDYQIPIMDQVEPLYLDVIQITHAWSADLLDEWIYFEFYLIPTKYNLTDVWIAWWAQASLDPPGRSGSGFDNLVYYDAERHMGIVEDQKGSDDDHIAGPVGYIIFPPDDIDPSSLQWTFNNRIMTDHFDEFQYDLTSAGTIDPPSTDGDGGDRGFFRLAFGPVNINKGDTLHFTMGEVFGEGKQNLLRNADRLAGLRLRDFKTPSPPPLPPLRVKPSNHAVTLSWDPQEGDVNPETYTDPNRFEYNDNPFEGYRIYKSMNSINGPWTLLQEFDVADNGIRSDIGISRTYTDLGLLNNIEYYYSVTAFSKPDSHWDELETGITLNAVEVTPGTAAPQKVGEVAVVPNPYRGDESYYEYKPPWEKSTGRGNRWIEQDRRIQFINLPTPCEIRIYTLAGDLIQTIQHTDSDRGFADWNLISRVGQTVASGIYLFSVEDKKNGDVQVGKFVIIK
jgi:hypothetical protein